ncbi:MAG: restriction endonuclease [Spirochaetes bacterium]|nr:restriction endonuclease [Spirochaetota bacterium]
MTIWVFNKPADEAVEYVFESLKKGYSRFGWSYTEKADLNFLKNKQWNEMDEDEIDCWSKANFLLQIEKDDWIVHINVPEWGYCTAVKVLDGYSFDNYPNELGDFKHRIKIDPKSIIIFNRDDNKILPSIRRRLKLQGSHWRIFQEDDFLKSLENLKAYKVKVEEKESSHLYDFKNELSDKLSNITELIQKHHPGNALEKLIANVFRKIPSVEEVIENNLGWKSDHGADLIVKYKYGLPISNLEKEGVLVVQVKSNEGLQYDLNAVYQLQKAIEVLKADMGMIVTTAEKTDEIEKEIDEISKKLDKPICLLAGKDVASFILKYGNDLIFDL